MEHVIDKGDSITHSALADKINELYNSPEKISAKVSFLIIVTHRFILIDLTV